MNSMLKAAAVLGATVLAAPAMAQTKVSIAISGWTGFAPLTLAKEAGIFAKNGLDVTIKKIPQASRHLAIASGDVQCAATTVETWVVWNANGVATTLDYPMVMDTFGCTPKFIAENDAAVKALTKSYFDALDMIKTDQAKAYEIMGADVKQSGEAFGKSAAYLRWQDKQANQKFFTGEHAAFSKEAADLLLEIGIIKAIPDMSKLADPKFVQ